MFLYLSTTLLALIINLFSFSTALAENATPSNEQLKIIAISIDDAPTDDGPYLSGFDRANLLIDNLRAAQVSQVVFFCNSRFFNPYNKERIEMYGEAGHLVANHTARHFDLDKVSVEKFIDDIEINDQYLRSLPNFYPYFRYPYFNDGTDYIKNKQVKNYLSSRHLKSGYATIEVPDWYLNDLWKISLKNNKSIPMEELKALYLKAITDSVSYYHKMAIKILNRSPHHVLVLHENDLAALFIKDLVEQLRTMGFIVVSPKVSYADPIANGVFDRLPNSQRRLAALNKLYGSPVPHLRSPWQDLTKIEKEFAKLIPKKLKEKN